MSWYIQVIKNYVNFSGRARRKEYWMFVLFNVIFALVAGLIDIVIGVKIVSTIYSLFVLIPQLSLSFRRLHDIDKSAWWLLIALIPVVGAIILLAFSLQAGTVGPNRFGEDPKQISAE